MLSSSTGSEMSEAIYEQLLEWKMEEGVVAACFDTTASNTGRFNGAAVLLEQKLGRNLLYFPCRHHIRELELRAAFESKFGATSSNLVPLFQRFQKEWEKTKSSQIQTGMRDSYVQKHLAGDADDIVEFCRDELRQNVCRDDYKELLQLGLVFLNKGDGIVLKKPGAMHHARWMAKAIYCLKIFLFRQTFPLTPRETLWLRDLCIYIVRFYIKFWFRSTIPSEAPNNDLVLLRQLHDYRKIDNVLATAVLNKTRNHLWYLSGECVALCLFDKNVSCEEKSRLVNEMTKENNIDTDDPKRINVTLNEIPHFLTKQLTDFVTPNTINFFQRFNIKTNFLSKDPQHWHSDAEYQNGLKSINTLKVVNDSAERGVKLIEEFNAILTKDEEQKQFLLQVVSDYRKQFPSHKKKDLSQQN